MPLSVVQAQSHQSTSAGSTLVTISTSAGSLLVLISVQNGSSTGTLSPNDTAGNTWTQAGSYGTSGNNRIAIFYVSNALAVASVTAGWSVSNARIQAVVYEISRAASASALDAVATATTGTGVTSLTSGSLTTTHAADILLYAVYVLGQASAETFSNGGGYSTPTNGNIFSLGTQYEIVSTIQSSVTASMSWNTSGNAIALFVSFKSGGVPNSLMLLGVGT